MNLLSEKEGMAIVQLAHNVVRDALGTKPLFPVAYSIPPLKKSFGVFITLWIKNTLRGCIGSPYPKKSIEEDVQEYAVFSATEDDRFAKISLQEINQLKIEVSILTLPRVISPKEIQIGVHGLLIRKEDKAGLLLPKVASENGWTTQTFLENACLKADLPKDAWEKDASIEAFEAQIFN